MTISTPNVVTHGDGFFVSYNLVDTYHYGSDTTALVLGNMDKFFILNGDHRKHYQELIPKGWDVCFEYYTNNSDQHNKRSDT